MRKTHDSQFQLGQVPIEEIEFNLKSRDDIPAVLLGLRTLWCTPPVREKIFKILQQHIRPEVSHHRGRPGMDLWCIFVLGTLKQALGCDYDRLKELVDEHQTLRLMLGFSECMPASSYGLQTIVDNVGLLTEAVLEKINAVVVACGHERLKHVGDASLKCRLDSAVTKTNVHWPTDLNLLWDAMRGLLRSLGRISAAHKIHGWRKSKDWRQKVYRAFQAVRTSRRSKNLGKVRAYLKLCRTLLQRARHTMAQLEQQGVCTDTLEGYWMHAQRQIDQVERRLIKNEEIPHEEKVFSIHAPYTRWINKGKAGVKAELGLPVGFLEDQYQFILLHQVQQQGTDSDTVVAFMKEALARYPSIASCSMDKAYHSPQNRKELDGMLELNVLPKKGKWSKSDRERETAPEFAAARQQHPAIESAINNLNHRGLDRIRTQGEDGFLRTVALSVVAANVHRLGQITKQQLRKRQQWYQARRKAA